ncbi:hypothetical protein GCM10018987_24330 [Streptomyces cremeus]
MEKRFGQGPPTTVSHKAGGMPNPGLSPRPEKCGTRRAEHGEVRGGFRDAIPLPAASAFVRITIPGNTDK